MTFVLSNPYNSPFLMKWLKDTQHPVFFQDNCKFPYQNLLNKITYINSNEHLLFSLRANEKILINHKNYDLYCLLNDKHQSRKMFNKHYPIMFKFFDSTQVFERNKDFNNIHKVVIKPINGIASYGVRIIDLNQQPKFIVPKNFIIEEYVDGQEFAIDGYIKHGKIELISINKHIFSNIKDVSDTLYVTSSKYFIEFGEKILLALNDIFYNVLQSLKLNVNDIFFPFHAEIKITKDNKIFPIEINPYRFSGYGTCELAYYAYNINPYQQYFYDNKTLEININDTSYYGFVDILKPNNKSNDEFISLFDEILEFRILPPNNDVRTIIFFRELSDHKFQTFSQINLANDKSTNALR